MKFSQRAFTDETVKITFLSRIISAIFTVTQSVLAIIPNIISKEVDPDAEVVEIAGRELYDCAQALLRLITNFEMSNIARLDNLKQV